MGNWPGSPRAEVLRSALFVAIKDFVSHLGAAAWLLHKMFNAMPCHSTTRRRRQFLMDNGALPWLALLVARPSTNTRVLSRSLRGLCCMKPLPGLLIVVVVLVEMKIKRGLMDHWPWYFTRRIK